MSNSRKVLWVSRHPMSDEQRSSLFTAIKASYNHKFAPPMPESIEVTSVNVTLPAYSLDAEVVIEDLLAQHGCDVLTGVFPAHVAARIATRKNGKYLAYVPVSVPVAAQHGETRGFEHSHWEGI